MRIRRPLSWEADRRRQPWGTCGRAGPLPGRLRKPAWPKRSPTLKGGAKRRSGRPPYREERPKAAVPALPLGKDGAAAARAVSLSRSERAERLPAAPAAGKGRRREHKMRHTSSWRSSPACRQAGKTGGVMTPARREKAVLAHSRANFPPEGGPARLFGGKRPFCQKWL